jgi:hypothetical protein
MDMLSADQIIDLRDHVTALLAITDESAISPDERECLLGIDQRCERAMRMRGFAESTRGAYGEAYRKLTERGGHA